MFQRCSKHDIIGATTVGDVGVLTPPKILRQLTDSPKFYTHTHSDRWERNHTDPVN
jgi:hypothetical protein